MGYSSALESAREAIGGALADLPPAAAGLRELIPRVLERDAA